MNPFGSVAAGYARSRPPVHARVLALAAGSLNYANLERFFPEAAHVMEPRGVLVVYNFGPGKRIRDSDGLEKWFAEFMRGYPAPLHGFRMLHASAFEIALELVCMSSATNRC